MKRKNLKPMTVEEYTEYRKEKYKSIPYEEFKNKMERKIPKKENKIKKLFFNILGTINQILKVVK